MSYKVKHKGRFWKNIETSQREGQETTPTMQYGRHGSGRYRVTQVIWKGFSGAKDACLWWLFKDWRMQTAWPEGDTNFHHLYLCALNPAEVGHPLCLSCHCSVSDPSIHPGGLDVLWRLDAFWRWIWQENPTTEQSFNWKQLIQVVLRNWSSWGSDSLFRPLPPSPTPNPLHTVLSDPLTCWLALCYILLLMHVQFLCAL